MYWSLTYSHKLPRLKPLGSPGFSIDEYIELLPEQIDLTLHASLASLLERKPSLPPMDNEGIILRSIERIKSLGDVSYRGKECAVHSIANDGKLILISGDELIEIDDGEAIEWLSLR